MPCRPQQSTMPCRPQIGRDIPAPGRPRRAGLRSERHRRRHPCPPPRSWPRPRSTSPRSRPRPPRTCPRGRPRPQRCSARTCSPGSFELCGFVVISFVLPDTAFATYCGAVNAISDSMFARQRPTDGRFIRHRWPLQLGRRLWWRAYSSCCPLGGVAACSPPASWSATSGGLRLTAVASGSQPSRLAAALSTPSTAACSWRFCARRRLDGTGFASWSGWPCGSPRLRVPAPAHLNSSNRLRHRRSAPPTPALYASGRQRRLPAHGLRDIQRRCQRHRQQHIRGGSLRGDELDRAGFASWLG